MTDKNHDKSWDCPSRQTLSGYSSISLNGINELRASSAPPTIPPSHFGMPVDVAAPTGWVVSTISSFIKGIKEITAPPEIARVNPIRISLSVYCIEILNPKRATIEIPNITLETKACRLDQFEINLVHLIYKTSNYVNS